jgi:putative tricarboxylic transport membrane protein
VWALIASLYIGNVMLLLLNLPLIRLWVKVLQIPRPVLYAGILLFAVLGVYSVSGNPTDILIALGIGVVGMFMRLYDFPIAPVILGAILGPNLESQLRRALTASNGDWTVFVTRPTSAIVLALAVVAFVVPYLPWLIRRARGEHPETAKVAVGTED